VKPSSFRRAVAAIAIGALILRIAYVLALGSRAPLRADGTWYALQAQTIANGAGYVDPRRYFSFHGSVATAQFPPLWPALLAVFNRLGIHSLRSYRMIGGFVGVITVVTTACIGRKLVDERVGLLAAGIVAVSPFMIAADGSLMADSLFIALMTAAVLLAIHVRQAPGLGWFALLGFTLGLATLTRSDGIVVGAVLVAVTAWCVPGAVMRRVGFAAVGGVVVLAVLVPWTVRNRDALDAFIPLSNNSGSLLGGANCNPAYGGRDIAGWAFSCISATEASDRTEVQRAGTERSAGLRYARDHLGRLAAVVPLRVVRGWGLWMPTVLADAEAQETRNRKMQLAGWPIELVISGLAVAGGVIAVRRRIPVALLFAVIGAATVVLAASWGNQRFRLVAEPELAVLAAVTLSALGTRRHVPAKRPVDS
jgi:hypothetical protein